jgi:phosphoribosylanthranilate isomerase
MGVVRVKICGVTNETDAVQAADFGADAIGLNFYSASPRFVATAVAQRILRVLPPFVEPVALFVNEPLASVYEALKALGPIRTVQWHGDDPQPIGDPLVRFVPAFAVSDRSSVARIDEYLARCQECQRLPAAILVDGHVAGEYGGTGQPAPWQLLADYRPLVPLILAGGLTPDNIAQAVRLVRPYAVDVASGVESSPGRKDADKMRRFIDNARSA